MQPSGRDIAFIIGKKLFNDEQKCGYSCRDPDPLFGIGSMKQSQGGGWKSSAEIFPLGQAVPVREAVPIRETIAIREAIAVGEAVSIREPKESSASVHP